MNYRSTRFIRIMGRAAVGLTIVLLPLGCASTKSVGRFAYPEAHKGDVVDEYHGVQVPDPYRWLEDPDTPGSRDWIEAENKVTFGYLESIPERDTIRKRLTDLWNYEKYGLPYRKGDRYFFTRNDGLQNQDVLYTVESLNGSPRVLLDPNKLSKDGTVALSGTAITDNGSLLAYGLATAGSDWQEWRVRDVANGRDLDDHVEWVKFSGASWTKDGTGFYYSRYDEPKAGAELQEANYYHKLYYHRLGEPQSQDELVYHRPDQKEWGFGAEVTEDGRYLVINVWRGTERKNLIFYKDLEGDGTVVELIRDFEAEYNFIDNDGSTFYFHTDLDAPKYHVLAIDITTPQKRYWREIVPESESTLRNVSSVGGRFFASYLTDAHSQVSVFDRGGTKLREVGLPGLGSAYGFRGRREDMETFYLFTSFTDPGTIFRYDIETGRSEVFRRPDVDFDQSQYVTKQVFYTSKDGTRVPMFITHKKGLKRDGRNPTLLYGYGGFNIPITPGFRVSNLVWMEMGGVYAVANLRGGGEYGKGWHEAGMKLNKQNVFDDFIAAAEWLIENDYTNPKRLAIRGGSNGGLLVGACMTQRPDLFGVALPSVGVMDMLRFNKFTIGWAWVSDYGTPDNADEFAALYAYSPLHNLAPGTKYPSTLITTADHDDRVVPAHSFKFAATLQEAHAGANPVLIRIQTKAGHGAGKPTSMRIEEAADILAFMVDQMGLAPRL